MKRREFIVLLGRWQIEEGYNSGARIQESTS
jgi:hypothetical protein